MVAWTKQNTMQVHDGEPGVAMSAGVTKSAFSLFFHDNYLIIGECF